MPSAGRRKSFRRKPYTRRRKPFNTRKRKYSKYNRKYTRGIARAPNQVFPQQMFKCLTYSTGPFRLGQSVADVPAHYTMNGNSLYDPDAGLGGQQPRWFDTLCGANGGTQPYTRYQVNASKITVTIWQDPTLTGTVGSVAGIVSVLPYRSPTTTPTSFKEIMERAFIRYVNVNNANSSKPLVVKHFAKTKALWQGTSAIGGDSDFSGSYNGNPSNGWLWDINCCNVIPSGGVSGLFGVYINIKVKYYAKFWSLNDVTDS